MPVTECGTWNVCGSILNLMGNFYDREGRKLSPRGRGRLLCALQSCDRILGHGGVSGFVSRWAVGVFFICTTWSVWMVSVFLDKRNRST